jgi:hypothetical protein
MVSKITLIGNDVPSASWFKVALQRLLKAAFSTTRNLSSRSMKAPVEPEFIPVRIPLGIPTREFYASEYRYVSGSGRGWLTEGSPLEIMSQDLKSLLALKNFPVWYPAAAAECRRAIIFVL